MSTFMEDVSLIRPTEMLMPPRITSMMYDRFQEAMAAGGPASPEELEQRRQASPSLACCMLACKCTHGPCRMLLKHTLIAFSAYEHTACRFVLDKPYMKRCGKAPPELTKCSRRCECALHGTLMPIDTGRAL